MMKNKHTKQLTGGFHCSTNEINREDVHGFARILETKKENLPEKDLAGLFDMKLLSFLQ